MGPLIIIPTYWTHHRAQPSKNPIEIYDHPTLVDGGSTLGRCLESLRGLERLDQILILVAADRGIANQAEDRVAEIVAEFPDLNIVTFGPTELGQLHRRFDQMELSNYAPAISLTGYGAVRNTGLAIAAILGHDMVIFIDDDEVITDPAFLTRALEGTGQVVVEGGQQMIVKTGYYIDSSGNWAPKVEKNWYDRWWGKTEAFNRWMKYALSGTRFKRSNTACGGCMALHAAAFKRIPFDPWVTRGEDIDYVISTRMLGLDIYFDNQWQIQHLSAPKERGEATRFKQNIIRWIYEHRKIEYGRSQVDLLQVTPRSLMPYPGPFLEASVGWRARITALMRSLGRSDTKGYFGIARRALKEASDYSAKNCNKYFDFLKAWPSILERLTGDVALKGLITGERHIDREGLTGRFPAVNMGDQPTPVAEAVPEAPHVRGQAPSEGDIPTI